MANSEAGWTDNMNELERTIIERISDAAIELMIARHSLYDDDGEELEQEAIVMMKSDVVACMTGDDPGCNDPDELDETNCELLWLRSILTGRGSRVWSDEFPQAEETFYWMRHKENHGDINMGLLRDRTLLLAEGGTQSKSPRKDYEYLSASPSDAEQLIELRKAHDSVLRDLKQAAFAYHVEANHKPSAFADCRNGICANACRMFNADVESNPKHPEKETQSK